MWVVLILFLVAFSSSEKIENEDDEEGVPPIPKTSFTCEGKIDGFYADIETGCDVYHYCQTFVFPEDDSETKDWPFRCPPTTIFRQQHLTCAKPHKNFKCEESEKYYYVNEKPPGTNRPPAGNPVLPEERPSTTTPNPTTSIDTEPPFTTDKTEKPTTTEKTEKPSKPASPDDGILLPPLKPGEIEDQFFTLPPLLPYLIYPSLLPPWIHLQFKNQIALQSISDYLKNFDKLVQKEPVQTLDDYLKKTSWEIKEKTLKKGNLPASTKLLEAKHPELTIPKFDKKLFETTYTIKNGKLTNEPFKFKFYNLKPTR